MVGTDVCPVSGTDSDDNDDGEDGATETEVVDDDGGDDGEDEAGTDDATDAMLAKYAKRVAEKEKAEETRRTSTITESKYVSSVAVRGHPDLLDGTIQVGAKEIALAKKLSGEKQLSKVDAARILLSTPSQKVVGTTGLRVIPGNDNRYRFWDADELRRNQIADPCNTPGGDCHI